MSADTPPSSRILRGRDIAAGLAIAAVMAAAFAAISSGLSLVVTFVPGLVFSLILLGIL